MKQKLTIGLVLLLSVGCGGGIDKKPVNGSANNVVANNATTNSQTNSTTNNVVTNSKTNNVATNDGTPCVDVSPTSLSFGEVTVGQSSRATFTLENCSGDVALSVDSVSVPNGFRLGQPDIGVVQPLQTSTVEVVFEPQMAATYSGEIEIDTDAGSVGVTVTGDAVEDATCPTPIPRFRRAGTDSWTTSGSIEAGATVELDGSQSVHPEGTPITSYEWAFVNRPAESTARLMPQTDVVNPQFLADASGTYEVSLWAFTDDSPRDCMPARLTIEASPVDGDIRIELVWDTPADPDQTDTSGTDLDLHYLHPSGQWNMGPYACFWQNVEADWGADGLAKLLREDTDGAGPEEIVHTNPGAGSYGVGVYYYGDNGFGPSYATVRIWVDGTLKLESKDEYLATTSTFWHVADVEWPSGSVSSRGIVQEGFPN